MIATALFLTLFLILATLANADLTSSRKPNMVS